MQDEGGFYLRQGSSSRLEVINSCCCFPRTPAELLTLASTSLRLWCSFIGGAFSAFPKLMHIVPWYGPPVGFPCKLRTAPHAAYHAQAGPPFLGPSSVDARRRRRAARTCRALSGLQNPGSCKGFTVNCQYKD